MQQNEVIKALEQGAILMMGTYWDGELQPFEWTDSKNSGKRTAGYRSAEMVMPEKGLGISVQKTYWRASEIDPLKWKPSAKRYDKVIVKITSMEVRNTVTILEGTIEPLVLPDKK